jgi:hypothetical protein
LRSTVSVGGANGGVPGVARVAIRATTDFVQPAPVGVEDDGAADISTTTRFGALLPGKSGVSFGSVDPNLLRTRYGSEDESDERMFLEHDCYQSIDESKQLERFR